jgi:hypothetical protein
MRGKKKDSEFLSIFIQECIVDGIDTPDRIVETAKKLIEKIDDQIKAVEQARVMRSKLLDVVAAFETPTKTHRPEEIRALSFLKIKNPKVCHYICKCLKTGALSPDLLFDSNAHPQADLIFGAKQLMEHKVIARAGENFVRGEQFNDYLKFIGSP